MIGPAFALVCSLSMNMRALFIVTLALFSAPASAAPTVRPMPGATPAARPAPKVAPTPPMVFYVVRGAPDACGRGCDSWIAAEGQIDAAAALRFRKFLARVRDRNLPIYFSSPGGNLDQALAMGAMFARSAKFSSEGLAGAVNSLLATCTVPKSTAALQTVGSREDAAK